ncbi:hypothetical protein C2G38_2160641 [Gigaspora rosea]|uniref:Uncharacterized protein n=1 Tax=Gigaspora rosea TaxID=44941 RepID=A0A397W553_9GLOM|nr:hypothetical protein C2G38_2160641 [Gigaspora rosea]
MATGTSISSALPSFLASITAHSPKTLNPVETAEPTFLNFGPGVILYQQRGLTAKHKTYRFFKNLYQYEEREVIFKIDSKLDALTNQYLAPNLKKD